MQFKKNIILFLFLSIGNLLFGQENPVKWQFKAEKIGANEYNIICVASIQEAWATYSQYQESDDGPIPTTISYTSKAGIELVGKNQEAGHLKVVDDKMFGMKVSKFTEEAIFHHQHAINRFLHTGCSQRMASQRLGRGDRWNL